jgi:hypothetical protein
VPERPNGSSSRNTVKETHIKRPIQKALGSVSIARQGSGRIEINQRIAGLFIAQPQNAFSRPGHQWTQGLLRREANLTQMGVVLGTTGGGTGSRAGPRLTCVCLDRPISGGTDNVCKKATLVQRVTHLVRFQAYRSVELGTDTRHKCWYQSSTGM